MRRTIHVGQPRSAVGRASSAAFAPTAEGGTPSRQPAGRRRYVAFAAAPGLLSASSRLSAESFNAARAMQYTREVVAFGARPIGSANHKKLENYILTHLKGDRSKTTLSSPTLPKASFRCEISSPSFPERATGSSSSPVTMTPTIRCAIPAMSAPTTAALPLPSCWNWPTSFAEKSVKATASGCCGPMGKRRSRNWTDTDSLYGVAPPGRKMAEGRHAQKDQGISAGRHDWRRRPERGPRLRTPLHGWRIWSIRQPSKLGYQSHFFARTIAVEDDHLPFVQRGVPSRRSD